MSDGMQLGVDEMLKVILARHGWDNTIVSSFVLVAELVTSDDGLQLVTITDPVAPYWRHRGMVDACTLEPDEYDDED